MTTTTENSGSAVQVATVVPKVTASLADCGQRYADHHQGDGFDETASNNTVTFDNGAAGTVSAASDTQLTVDFTTNPTEAGPLSVTVTTNTVASVAAAQVATVAPVITSSTATWQPTLPH